MCVYSFIGDHFRDKWDNPPYTVPPHNPAEPKVVPSWPLDPWEQVKPKTQPQPKPITPEELEDFKDLLRKAKQYDKDNGEPDCETEDKFKRIREILAERGIDVSFLDTGDVESAAIAFQKEFAGDNLCNVGIADQTIVAYVKKKLKLYPKEYEGFKVELQKGGKLLPL